MAPEQYYRYVRREVMPFLPHSIQSVLELGCGAGGTLSAIKELHPHCVSYGVEIGSAPAEAARRVVDHVYCGDAEGGAFESELKLTDKSLDVILCLDVLEHLVDPWSMAARLARLLRPGGVLVASIPNIRFAKVSLGLVLRGEWSYQPSGGILDQTHLRFFTRKTACELLTGAGLSIAGIGVTGLEPGRPAWLADLLSAGLLRDFLAYQYLIAAHSPAEPQESR